MFWSKMLWKLPSVFLSSSFSIHNVFDMPSVHPCSVEGKPDLVWGVCPTGWSRHHEKVCSGNRGPPNGAAWSSQSNPPHHPVKWNQIESSWWHTSIISEVSLEEVCWSLELGNVVHYVQLKLLMGMAHGKLHLHSRKFTLIEHAGTKGLKWFDTCKWTNTTLQSTFHLLHSKISMNIISLEVGISWRLEVQ